MVGDVLAHHAPFRLRGDFALTVGKQTHSLRRETTCLAPTQLCGRQTSAWRQSLWVDGAPSRATASEEAVVGERRHSDCNHQDEEPRAAPPSAVVALSLGADHRPRY